MAMFRHALWKWMLIVGIGLVILWIAELSGLRAQGVLTGSYENLPLGGGRLTVTINVGLQRWNQLYIQVGATDVTAAFRVITPGWQLSGIVRDEFGRSLLLLRRNRPKVGLETVIVEGPEGRGRLGALALAKDGFRFLTAASEPSFLPVEAPPGGGSAHPLKRFDVNGNDLIDDPEFFAIIDAWIAGQLDDPTFFQAIDLWVSQRPLSSASAELRAGGELRLGRSGVEFTLRGAGIASWGVEIYALDGRRLFARETTGTKLYWNYLDMDGSPVANGVYLYMVTVRGADGRVERSRVKKLVVLRRDLP